LCRYRRSGRSEHLLRLEKRERERETERERERESSGEERRGEESYPLWLTKGPGRMPLHCLWDLCVLEEQAGGQWVNGLFSMGALAWEPQPHTGLWGMTTERHRGHGS